MFSSHHLHRQICASCRLRSSIAAKQLARTRRPNVLQARIHQFSRPLSSTTRVAQRVDQREWASEQNAPEVAAMVARKKFGRYLPEGELSHEAYLCYERLYGPPLDWSQRERDLEDAGDEAAVRGVEAEAEAEAEEQLDAGTGVLKEGEDGGLEEVEFDAEESEVEETATPRDEQRVKNSADAQLAQDMEAAMSGRDIDDHVEAEELDEDDEGSYQRAHPLTPPNRFSTSPSTLPLPIHHLVEPIAAQLSHVSNTHLKEHAHRLFGGLGLPYSTSTPAIGKPLQQKPIPFDAGQSSMSEIEADVFMAVLVPGMYASAMSVLVETRKRLGSEWVEATVRKAETGDLRVLDAGGAGSGVLAVRELVKAEWERMHEENGELDSDMSLAEADGKIGGASVSPPLGHGTVLVGSDELRRRASLLLENTTFIPRLPNYLHAEDAKKKGKFDIIIAPHTLWSLKENYMRKAHLQNLWSMLKQDGGVLVLLEKGVARGFEIVAAARQTLLENHIASPTSMSGSADTNQATEKEDNTSRQRYQKEEGMIIAPCTNHTDCPMYLQQGHVKGRRDICHFSQRYVRPPFLQTILAAKDKNFEDVKFSYLSVMRGRDLRQEHSIAQNMETTDSAFAGYEHVTNPEQVHSLTLPRSVLPPLKRHGHIILDLCTPAGTLERWTVPKSFGKQAFRDARKSSWGDLWALGAKTRVPRVPKVKKRNPKGDKEAEVEAGGFEWKGDTYGEIVTAKKGGGGKMRKGGKIKGLRDKRDKRGDGNGRRKNSEVD